MIFARSGTADAEAKNIPNGISVFDALTHRAITCAKKTDIAYFLVSEPTQVGDSFGIRYTNAIQRIFDLGYNAVITIGNDTPQLTTSLLRKAAGILEQGNTIIGPSTDGGFYLLGIHRCRFDQNILQSLSWGSRNVGREITAYFSELNSPPIFLRTFNDLDSHADFMGVLPGIAKSLPSLAMLIRTLVLDAEERFFFVPRAACRLYFAASYNKGSPVRLEATACPLF